MIPYIENKVKRMVSLDDAIKVAQEDFSFSQVPLLKKDFIITPEGNFTIQKLPYPITKGGIQNLCSMLRIPDPFANRIPTDLFIDNVNRLLKEEPEKRVNAYFDKDGKTVIDVNSKINLQNIPTQKLLTMLDKENKVRVMFENHFVKIETLPSDSMKIEVKGQAHAIGNVIYHYPTCKSVPQGYLVFWTLVCTNGAVAPRQIMREKLNIKSSSDADLLIQNFMERIGKKVLGKEKLEEAFKRLNDTTFMVNEVKKLYASVRRAVGKDEIETVLGNDFVNHYDSIKESEDNEEFTDVNKYDVYYKLTYYASNITQSAKLSRKFQSQAGKLLLLNEV